jgi:hypothetical protein
LRTNRHIRAPSGGGDSPKSGKESAPIAEKLPDSHRDRCDQGQNAFKKPTISAGLMPIEIKLQKAC